MFNFDNDTRVAHWGWIGKCDFLLSLIQNSFCRVFSADTREKSLFFTNIGFIKTSKITFTQIRLDFQVRRPNAAPVTIEVISDTET